jgi:SAM-dependent methyltransferase
MFDFVRKSQIWNALDNGRLAELDSKISFQLKTMQDLAVYEMLRDHRGSKIAEIGGGNSRILRRLAQTNQCYNIEKFEGIDGGPKGEINIPGVTNVDAYVGDFDGALEADSFDVAFSVSVVEHVVDDKIAAFHRDLIRILKPGGIFLHAIDLYLADEPSSYWVSRYGIYRSWVTEDRAISPIGQIFEGPLSFSCSMASNPDNILHGWGALVPSLTELRTQAQNVSLLVAGRKSR